MYTSSEGSNLQFRSPYSGKTRTILDANQNAGCCIFGHHPPASVDALEALLAARRPLRLPFARSSDEEALRSELLARAALGEGSRCVLGLSSGAQAIDLALSLALTAPRPGGPLFDPCDSEPPPPMSVVLLRGSFHGNCTRAAFSSSAVFRAHAQRETLCEFTAIYLDPDADAAAVDAAFAAHDAGGTAIVAVVVEPQQHFAAFARLASPTAAALGAAAARRGVPVICDEIWSGVHRTGSFLACTSGGLRPDMVVLAKGLCAGVAKQAALLLRDGFDHAAILATRAAEPSAVGCAAAAACLRAAPPERVAARAREVERAVGELSRAHGGRLLPVRGRGFSYEVELRATAELAAAGWGRAASVATALALLHALWWGGALVLPRPLRAPRRFHCELAIDVSDDELRRLFSALDGAAGVAAALRLALLPFVALASVVSAAAGLLRPAAAAGAEGATTTDGPLRQPHPGLPRVAAAAAAAGRQRYLLDDGGHLPEYDEAAGELLAPAGSGGLAEARPADAPLVIDYTSLASRRGLPSGVVVDCCADVSTSILGHHPPPLAAALRDFVRRREHAFPFGLLFMKPTAQRLCADIATMAAEEAAMAAVAANDRSGDELDDEALALALRCESEPFTAKLMLSATDANEAAVRLCLVHWQRRRGGRAAEAAAPIVLVVRGGACHGGSWLLGGLPTAAVRLVEMTIEELQSAQALARRLTPDVAALLVEPVCSATGRVAVEGAAQAAALRRACARAGVPLIADETRCGLGRCGALLCAEARGLAPAVTTLGDALGGGFAQLAAVVYDEAALGGGGGGKAPPFPSTATLCNDSLSSHVGLAAVHELRRLAPKVRAAAAAFELELRTTLDGSRPTVERVGGCGLMVSVRFAPDRCAAFAARRGARRDAPPNLALYSYLLDEHAVRVRPSTTDESAVLVEPPAVASAAAITRVCTALRAAAEEMGD